MTENHAATPVTTAPSQTVQPETADGSVQAATPVTTAPSETIEPTVTAETTEEF